MSRAVRSSSIDITTSRDVALFNRGKKSPLSRCWVNSLTAGSIATRLTNLSIVYTRHAKQTRVVSYEKPSSHDAWFWGFWNTFGDFETLRYQVFRSRDPSSGMSGNWGFWNTFAKLGPNSMVWRHAWFSYIILCGNMQMTDKYAVLCGFNIIMR